VLKTTAIGGLLFLLPLIVLGALIAQVVPVVMSVARGIGAHLPLRGTMGVTILVLLAVAAILLLCFVAGLVARVSFGHRFSKWLEKNIEVLFPRYLIIRERMAETVGGESAPPHLKPVLVTFDDHQRLAFESDRHEKVVTVFLPASPDPWSGELAFVPSDRVTALDVDFADATAACKRLGRDSLAAVGLGKKRSAS
jgi:uncharacterized membrane protein